MAASVAPELDQVNVTGTEPVSLLQPADELFEGENDSKTGPVATGGELGFGGVLGAVSGASFGLSLGVSLAVTSGVGVALLVDSGPTPPVPRAKSKVRRTITTMSSTPPTTASVVMRILDRFFAFGVAVSTAGSPAGGGGVKRSVGVSSLIGGSIHSRNPTRALYGGHSIGVREASAPELTSRTRFWGRSAVTRAVKLGKLDSDGA